MTDQPTNPEDLATVRAALKPSHRLTLGYLIHDAQQDTYPLAQPGDTGGPYIVQGCVVNSAQQLKDCISTIWKRVPRLLDELEAARAENARLRERLDNAEGKTAAVHPSGGIVVNIDPPRGNSEEAFAAGRASMLGELRRRGGLR